LWRQEVAVVAPAATNGQAAESHSTREEIYSWVANLSNHITAERAMNALKRAKVKHPSEFRKVRPKPIIIFF
jgi:hypothetical protein